MSINGVTIDGLRFTLEVNLTPFAEGQPTKRIKVGVKDGNFTYQF